MLAVEAIRSVNGSNKVEAEIRYFLSRFAGDPSILAKAIRRHWSIENNLHWVLDVTFREDDCRIRDAIAARNFALLRKIAINLLTQDRSTKAPADEANAKRPPRMTTICCSSSKPISCVSSACFACFTGFITGFSRCPSAGWRIGMRITGLLAHTSCQNSRAIASYKSLERINRLIYQCRALRVNNR